MKKSLLLRRAVTLRKQGISLRNIATVLGISPSTASIWVKDISLSEGAKKKLLKLQVKGRERGRKTLLQREREKKQHVENLVNNTLGSLAFTKAQYKALCALIYGCEGSKLEKGRVVFINSDPELIGFFMDLFRASFTVHEKKFRALIHLHSYHDEDRQIRFWSKVTGIPHGQFSKSFQKQQSGKTVRAGYRGCISIRYGNAAIQNELVMLYKKMLLQRSSLIKK